MKQHLCDHCGEILDMDTYTGDESAVHVGIATWSKHDIYWKEFHRRCVRTLTVADVWQRQGLVPL